MARWFRFTERARRVVFYAAEEANGLGQGGEVGTEHLLLGLTRQDDDGLSVAIQILNGMGFTGEQIRKEIERQAPLGQATPGSEMQLTPQAKRVIDLAYEEAAGLHNDYIGTEHLLLGLIRDEEGCAGRVLTTIGVDLNRTRNEIQALQNQSDASA